MWNNTSGYDSYNQGGAAPASSAQGGGGYMSPGGFGTPQQSQERKSRSKVQSLMPCTVSQLLGSAQTEEKFFSGDNEISQVTIVGLVKSVKESPTRIDYEIEDMSGPPIEVKQFVDNDESLGDNERTMVMRENTYVRICGNIRSFGGKRSVIAFKMMPVTDLNELTTHILEVIHCHAALAQANTMANAGTSSNTMSNAGDMGGYGNAPMGSIAGLNQLQTQIHLLIKGNPTDQGASTESVCKQLGGVPNKVVKEAIEFLSTEGHIYSTIDEDHFKATDG